MIKICEFIKIPHCCEKAPVVAKFFSLTLAKMSSFELLLSGQPQLWWEMNVSHQNYSRWLVFGLYTGLVSYSFLLHMLSISV